MVIEEGLRANASLDVEPLINLVMFSHDGGQWRATVDGHTVLGVVYGTITFAVPLTNLMYH